MSKRKFPSAVIYISRHDSVLGTRCLFVSKQKKMGPEAQNRVDIRDDTD